MIQDHSAGLRGTRCLAIWPACAAVALLAISGCAPGLAPAPTSGRAAVPGARPAAGYERLQDDLRSVDSTALIGRRIVLDPGHGGFFRGALGSKGLTEAEVNLGVALDLRGLLEARGALVFMTRTDDRDFLSPSDSALRVDLAERVRIANSLAPDLFVSIHHNADARGAHDVNETQTYYKLGDEGPSLDAAQSVHRFLVRNLGIEKNRVMPGNYYVLRNTSAPALLTESSYITNPDVEAKLVLASKQRLEAEALLLGIAHYFGRRAPEVVELAALPWPGTERTTAAPDSVFGDRGEPLLRGRIRGAFDQAVLALDGAPLPVVRRGDVIEAAPPLLAPGEHIAVLDARLSGRGAGRPRALRFTVRRGVDRDRGVRVETWPATVHERDDAFAVRVSLRDVHGFPVTDSIAVRIRAPRGLATPEDTTATARDGVAWAYFRPLPGGGAPRSSRGAGDPASRTSDPQITVEVRDAVTPLVAKLPLRFASGSSPSRALFLRVLPRDTVLAGAPGTREPRAPNAWLNRDGFAVLPGDGGANLAPPALPGYRPWGRDAATTAPVAWSPIAGGALIGRRIVIDPDGGGDEAAGIGKNGTRAANLNLDVARALEGFLAAAGAEVRLTRGGDLALSEVERVQISEGFHADRFVRIGHRSEKPMLGYYYSSVAGRRWAEGTARELARLGFGPVAPAEDAQYPLQQTSCPALYIAPARVDQPASEDRLLAPGTVRAEAYAIFLGLAREWTPPTDWPLDSIEVRDGEGRPAAGAAVVLGGSMVLETDPLGRVRFARTEPGPLEIEVRHPRVSERRLLLESQRSIVLTGSRGP